MIPFSISGVFLNTCSYLGIWLWFWQKWVLHSLLKKQTKELLSVIRIPLRRLVHARIQSSFQRKITHMFSLRLSGSKWYFLRINRCEDNPLCLHGRVTYRLSTATALTNDGFCQLLCSACPLCKRHRTKFSCPKDKEMGAGHSWTACGVGWGMSWRESCWISLSRCVSEVKAATAPSGGVIPPCPLRDCHPRHPASPLKASAAILVFCSLA